MVQFQSQKIIAGTDEAGRGCLAGPVTAAAVILPLNFKLNFLNDSKLLSASNREKLRIIIEKEALSYGIAHVFQDEIDTINILNASIKAMHLALDKLAVRPDHILVDGNRFKNYLECTHDCMVKGDSRFMSIAAASILAKTERDRYMQLLHKEFEKYNWSKNKGYPTAEHRRAIMDFGKTAHHRNSFRLLSEQLKLNFE